MRVCTYAGPASTRVALRSRGVFTIFALARHRCGHPLIHGNAPRLAAERGRGRRGAKGGAPVAGSGGVVGRCEGEASSAWRRSGGSGAAGGEGTVREVRWSAARCTHSRWGILRRRSAGRVPCPCGAARRESAADLLSFSFQPCVSMSYSYSEIGRSVFVEFSWSGMKICYKDPMKDMRRKKRRKDKQRGSCMKRG